MITLYLDMDGVLCNFNKRYTELSGPDFERKKFRTAVMEHKIFENLEFLPDTQELLNHVCKLPKDVELQILTSMGTFDPEQGNEARRQKQRWLDKYNIPYKSNFVRTKHEKAQYATPNSILIDDSIGCITPFIEELGHGILHVNATDSVRILDATLTKIRKTNGIHR